MPRQRYQRGSLSKTGKRRKMWMGLYHVYVTIDGKEKRREKTRILGPCSQMTKSDAQIELDRIIADSTKQSGSVSSDCTFAELWEAYKELKRATWGSATGRAVSSVFKHHVIPVLGAAKVRLLTTGPMQTCLNEMAKAGASYSVVHKARTYLAAALEYAVREKAIASNPAESIDVPTRLLTQKIDERFYSLEECRNLLTVAQGREHLIVRLFLTCGFRPAELFALRLDDIEHGRIRIDEALKETEKGDRRIGDTKTVKSTGYVSISEDMEREICNFLLFPTHVMHARSFLFPSSTGTPYQIRNYLKRWLQPLGLKAGIADINYQALRRTFATHFQRHGTPRSAQAAMRHASLRMTGYYMKEIPEEVVKSVASWDAELRADGRVM